MKNMNRYFLLVCAFLVFAGCKDKSDDSKVLSVEDIFGDTPVSVLSVAKSYQSNVTAEAINDMDESILCMSTRIKEKSNTYFIQPDKVPLKDLSIRYAEASVVDMKTALLISDVESGKKTLIYLPGRFPIDSMTIKPDVMIPVMGISSYHSEIENITSRWTEIVCKCTDLPAGSRIYKDRTLNDCDSGGTGQQECSLTTDGSVMTCVTQCRAGTIACCWFEF